MFAKTKRFFSTFNIDVSSLLMSALRAIVICQKYFGNLVISSQIHLFAPLLNMRRCTLWTMSGVWILFAFYYAYSSGRLLFLTPGPVPLGTCICSNVETIFAWACHVFGYIGTCILLLFLFCLIFDLKISKSIRTRQIIRYRATATLRRP